MRAPKKDQWGGVLGRVWRHWEWIRAGHVEPASAASAPSARYAAGWVWGHQRQPRCLFRRYGEARMTGLKCVPKQDTWEWIRPSRTGAIAPSQGEAERAANGHAMAYDTRQRRDRGLMGGSTSTSGYALADVWEWDPTSGAWSNASPANEPNLPGRYLRLARHRPHTGPSRLLVGGGIYPMIFGTAGPADCWGVQSSDDNIHRSHSAATARWPSPRSNPRNRLLSDYRPRTPTCSEGWTYSYGLLDELWE